VSYEFRVDGQPPPPPPPLDVSRMLNDYLERTGGRSRDAYGFYTENVLRELLSVLEAVLDGEHVPRTVAYRILRGVIYGGRPHRADEDARQEMTKMLTDMAMRQPPIPRHPLNLPPQ
jgi:hypothetical protein